MLNTVVNGTADGRPPLLIAHGLFGSARNWGVLAKRLSADRQVLTVDMRNHGTSPHTASHSYADLADDLAEVIAAHGGQADVLGHSMGGKAAMVLALSRPATVGRLVVADIAPVAYTHSQMALTRAMQGLDLSQIASRRDADIALADQIPDAPVRAFLLQSLDRTGDRPRWMLNLDALADEMDKIVGFPDVSGQFTGPTLFLTGGTSDYVLPEYGERIRALFPAATIADIAGAGHWLHADKPREFEAAVRDFLG